MITHPMLVPVILSGGAGTRLWPVSRELHPKPFMLLPDGQSLLQKTFARASMLDHVAEIMTITNKEYFLKTKSAYAALNNAQQFTQSFLLEPTARNTAPAITLAALKINDTIGHDAMMLVLPADHLIDPLPLFKETAEAALQLAANNKIVTFGIEPTAPESGYGYIELGNAIAANVYDVARFVEKPTREVAESYVASKQFLWNAGMFCFRVDFFLAQLAQYAPKLLQAAKICWEQTKLAANNPIYKLDTESFNQLENISLDYALMEKSAEIAVVRSSFNWQDIGSWEAYKQLLPTDQHGNTIVGQAITVDACDNLIKSENRLIAAIGINNLMIIDTPDALLIADRTRAQDVKTVVQALKDSAHESYLTHRTVIRPWGSYTVLEESAVFKIKRICVNPHASLSLQTHAKRSEHWVVVSGVAEIVNGDKTCILKTNESTFVPIGCPHRLSNPTDEPLIIIEVQTGVYLGEDDIVRLEDTYGR